MADGRYGALSTKHSPYSGQVDIKEEPKLYKSKSTGDIVYSTSCASSYIPLDAHTRSRTSQFPNNTSPDSDYRSEVSPLLDDGESQASGEKEAHVTKSCDSGRHSDWVLHRGSNGPMFSGSTWPLAEGNGWVANSPDEQSALAGTSVGNYNTLSRDSVTSITDTDDGDNDSDAETKPFKFSSLTRNQKVILAGTSVTNLMSFLSLSILAPFFPLEADKKNVNGTISGWIFGIFALVQFLTSPLFGRLIPITGSKFMYLAGLFVCGGCTLCFGVLDRVDTSDGTLVFIMMCFITRILLALGCTALSNSGFVMLVRAFPDNVATVFGIGEIFTGIGMVTGPAIGGFLYDSGGFILPFAVIGTACLVFLPILWLSLPVQDDSLEPESENISLLRVLLNPKSLVNSVSVVIAASIWAVLDPTLEPHLRVYGLTPTIVGFLFLIMAAFYSVSSPLWGWLADKLPDNRTVLLPGFILAAVGLLLAGPSPLLGFDLSYNKLWLTVISLVILGVASSMCVIPTYDIYIDVLSDVGYTEDTRTYGMVSSIWVSMYALGDFVGPSLGGFLDQEVGFEWLTTYFAAACIFTFLLIAVTWYADVKCRKGKRPEDKAPLLLPSSGTEDSLISYPPYNFSTSH